MDYPWPSMLPLGVFTILLDTYSNSGARHSQISCVICILCCAPGQEEYVGRLGLCSLLLSLHVGLLWVIGTLEVYAWEISKWLLVDRIVERIDRKAEICCLYLSVIKFFIIIIITKSLNKLHIDELRMMDFSIFGLNFDFSRISFWLTRHQLFPFLSFGDLIKGIGIILWSKTVGLGNNMIHNSL